MTNIDAVIVDDERYAHIALKNYLKAYASGISLIGQCHSFNEALVELPKLTPSIIFLDIKLPDGLGLDLIKEVVNKEYQPLIICTTAYDHYAINALKNHVFDYLLKPLNPEEFQTTVTNAMAAIAELQSNDTNLGQQKLRVTDRTGTQYIPFSKIVRLEACGNYTQISLSCGSKVLVSKTLKRFENELNHPMFSRIHNSHILNLEHFDHSVSYKEVLLSNGELVPVSRARKNAFLAAIKSYLPKH